MTVYLILAFYGIDRQSLWEDEYLSILRTTASRHPIWKDGHGFLYFALLYVWNHLGSSEAMLRTLSVLLGAGAVCFLYALGSKMLDRRAAVIATVLFATSPFLIWYSQEVRYVTLTLLTTLISMYAFRRLISRPSLGLWFAYGTAALLAFFSFLSTLLLPVAQGLYLVASRSHRPLLKKWIFCQFVVFVVFASWFLNGTHFVRAIVEARDASQKIVANVDVFPFTGEFNEVRPGLIPYTFFALSAGYTLGPPPRELYANRSLAQLAPHAPTLLTLTALYGGLLIAGWLVLRRRGDLEVFLVLWLGVPVLGVFLIAKLLDVFYDVRYVAMVLPAYALLLAAGIAGFRKVWLQVFFLGAILSVHGVALGNYYFNPRYAREDTRAAGQFLEARAKPGDVILVVGTVSSLPYYYKGVLPLVNFDALNGAGQSLEERLQAMGAEWKWVWLVQIRPWQADRAGNIKAALDRVYEAEERRHFPGVEVYGYRTAAN